MMGRGSNRSASPGRLDLWPEFQKGVGGLGRARNPLGRGKAQVAVDVGEVRIVVIRDREPEFKAARTNELAKGLETRSRSPTLPASNRGLMPANAPTKLPLRQAGAEARFAKEIGAEHVPSITKKNYLS